MQPNDQPIKITGDLTIYQVAEWRERLLPALLGSNEIQLDLSEMGEIDTAGLQILIALNRQVADENGSFSIVSCSESVRQVIDFMKLGAWLSTPCETHQGMAA